MFQKRYVSKIKISSSLSIDPYKTNQSQTKTHIQNPTCTSKGMRPTHSKTLTAHGGGSIRARFMPDGRGAPPARAPPSQQWGASGSRDWPRAGGPPLLGPRPPPHVRLALSARAAVRRGAPRPKHVNDVTHLASRGRGGSRALWWQRVVAPGGWGHAHAGRHGRMQAAGDGGRRRRGPRR